MGAPMTERPILFSGPMVRAILAGTKTQIRRPVKLPSFDRVTRIIPSDGAVDLWDAKDERGATPAARMVWHSITCPYGEPGDRLWVKHSYWHYTPPTTNPSNEQAWDEITRCARWPSGESILDIEPDTSIRKHSDFDGGWKRRPSIHMPRWASRITLEVTEVRVQRLREISEEDAQAEGAEALTDAKVGDLWRFVDPRHDFSAIGKSARNCFSFLWDHINGKRAPWASNPWVWAVSFSVVARG
jgi:hypothetical protein